MADVESSHSTEALHARSAEQPKFEGLELERFTLENAGPWLLRFQAMLSATDFKSAFESSDADSVSQKAAYLWLVRHLSEQTLYLIADHKTAGSLLKAMISQFGGETGIARQTEFLQQLCSLSCEGKNSL